MQIETVFTSSALSVLTGPLSANDHMSIMIGLAYRRSITEPITMDREMESCDWPSWARFQLCEDGNRGGSILTLRSSEMTWGHKRGPSWEGSLTNKITLLPINTIL